MSRRQLDATGDRDALILGGGFAGLVLVAVAAAWLCLHTAAWLTGQQQPPANPVALVVELVKGRLEWTGTATGVAVALVLIVAALLFVALWRFPRRRKLRSDNSSRHMAKGTDLAHLTAAGSTAKGTGLGMASPGLSLGRPLHGHGTLHASWEDVLVVIAGPRTQKTTAYAVPWVLQAPGPCLATSNKRDIADTTKRLRAQVGRVWMFDPQAVSGTTEPEFVWDPLSYVRNPLPDEGRAEKLARQLASSARPAGAKLDPYFDNEAENLIGLLLLAAACDHQSMTNVYRWLNRPEDDEPVELLRGHGFSLQEDSLYSLSRLPDKQRSGVYGTARSLLGWIRNRKIAAWITPTAGLREFSPTAYAVSTDTIYCLSRDDEGSAGPLVAALTMATLDALEERATASPGGRLPVPFVGVLDEAANVCRLRGLDGLYSHYGSRGLILSTIVQSWHQMADVWGDHGAEKLWGAATVKVYGGGADDDRFLRRLSELIGSTERIVRSASIGQRQRTITRSVQDHIILTPAELRELPKGRAVVFASGTPAVMIEPQPWFTGPDRQRIEAARV